jgi:hypothetical protein
MLLIQATDHISELARACVAYSGPKRSPVSAGLSIRCVKRRPR